MSVKLIYVVLLFQATVAVRVRTLRINVFMLGLLLLQSPPALLCIGRRLSRLRHITKIFVVLDLAEVTLEVLPEKHCTAAHVVAFRAFHPRVAQRICKPAHRHV